VGNGQYFDPETGRFLTRGNQRSESANPYTPWKGDPTQALVSPLILLALLYTRRKNRNKFDTLLVVLVLLSAVGLSLSAYTPAQAEALPVNSGGRAGAPSMPMGYASTAEAGTPSGVAAGNPGEAVESITTNSDCLGGKPKYTDWEDMFGRYIARIAYFMYVLQDDYYVWGVTDEDGNDAKGHEGESSGNVPVRRHTQSGEQGGDHGEIDLYERTGGRIPIVCADIIDMSYWESGFNLSLFNDWYYSYDDSIEDVPQKYPPTRNSYALYQLLEQSGKHFQWSEGEDIELGDMVFF
jgi:hypothetical protein